MTAAELRHLLANARDDAEVIWHDLNFGGKFDDVQAHEVDVSPNRIVFHPPWQEPLEN